jgi:hypothetical protein
MEIELDPKQKKAFEEAARAAGENPIEVLEDFTRRYVAERNGDSNDELAEQEKAWDSLLAELDALPCVPPADGICASLEHDKILYGGPSSEQRGGFPEKRS